MTKVLDSVQFNAAKAILCPPIEVVVQQAIDAQRLVGVVLLVARQGVLIHQQAAGFADREQGHPMQLESIFRWASLTKLVVSTAAMRLVAQGRLDLDTSIAHNLPEFQPRLGNGQAAQITLRQLLSHSAGLEYGFLETQAQGRYAQAGVSDGMDASGISLAENLRRLASLPLAYPPGSAWGYSLATDVLGALIARVQGVTLDVAIQQLVTDPLGMHDSSFVVSDPSRVATAYVNDLPRPHRLAEGETVSAFEGTVGICFSPSRIFDPLAFPSGGAGMAGSALDFFALLELLRQGGGDVLAQHWVEEMARDQVAGLDLATVPGYGFGLGFSVLRDPKLADSPESMGTWRWGGAYGHSWFVDRAQGLTVLAMSNTLYEGVSGHFVQALRDAVYTVIKEA
jgi:CubicO group peptidase (beta-lactamase class C family)